MHEDVLKADQHGYSGKWQMPILRELICLHDFRDDYKSLGHAVIPPITS